MPVVLMLLFYKWFINQQMQSNITICPYCTSYHAGLHLNSIDVVVLSPLKATTIIFLL